MIVSDREKLIQLISEIVVPYFSEQIADQLLANGVAFVTDTNDGSKWIPVTERLPEESDADSKGRVFARLRGEETKIWHWSLVVDYSDNFTHWMPMPKAPEEDDND